MFKAMAVGLAMAAGLASGSAWAGAFSVTTDFPTGIGGPYAADLAGIGVTVELASPSLVTVFQPTNLTFRLLESHASRQGTQITTLVVDGVDYDFGTQAFTAPGALLGSQLFSGDFSDLVGFRDATMPLLRYRGPCPVRGHRRGGRHPRARHLGPDDRWLRHRRRPPPAPEPYGGGQVGSG